MDKIVTDNSKVNINLLKENKLLKKQIEELLLHKKELEKQFAISGVVKSSDLWVVEFSDNEIKLMTSKELQDYENECMKFDGFMGCSVLGRLATSK